LQSLQFLAGFETNGFPRRNRYFCSCAGVPANSGFSWFHVKDTESAQFNAVAILERFFHMLEHGLNGHLGLGLRDAGFTDHFVDDIEFDQERLRIGQLDDRVEVTLMSSNLAQPCVSAVDPGMFRAACAKFSTGITIVTVMSPDGVPRGMTANSFTSVSLDPPMILICVDRKAAILPHLEAADHFGVNILNENQQDLSTQFARPGINRFETLQWASGELGVPLLPDVLATFECAVQQIVEAGDHRIFLATVCFINSQEGRPLVYFSSKYQTLS
jgi:flavin reductase (DIM6/NTAB) family NADH-FMN oxidoreductase RutF